MKMKMKLFSEQDYAKYCLDFRDHLEFYLTDFMTRKIACELHEIAKAAYERRYLITGSASVTRVVNCLSRWMISKLAERQYESDISHATRVILCETSLTELRNVRNIGDSCMDLICEMQRVAKEILDKEADKKEK